MKFVVAGYGSRGDVEPCIAVGQELLRRGHDVRMAVTVPPACCASSSPAGLTAVPYGRDWQALLRDEDFVRMMQNPFSAFREAIEYIAQVSEEKSTTLLSLTNGADLLLAGVTEQGLAANVADYYGIPLAALHFFPAQILELESPRRLAKRAEHAQRQALGLPEAPGPSARPLEIQTYDELCFPGRRSKGRKGKPTTLRRGVDAGVADGRRRRGVVVDCRWNTADLLRLWQHAARIPSLTWSPPSTRRAQC